MEKTDKNVNCGNSGRKAPVAFPMTTCCGSGERVSGASDVSCCSTEAESPLVSPSLNQPFVCGLHAASVRDVPRISSDLTLSDHWGTIKARWGVDRMHYAVDPGLYALGRPDDSSPVLVTANYKMSFDRLREALPGRNAWILVLDTKGINVWCAAGKGTFGTEELVRRIAAADLKAVVKHRQLILPQLGAPGVAAHAVKKLSGFQVQYGPICASDLSAYLDAGMKATAAMRRKTFDVGERVALIPIELIEALRAALVIIPVLVLIGGLLGREGFLQNVMNEGVFAAIAILAAIFAGVILNPLLLPYLPGRAFSTKGFAAGLAVTAVLLVSLWQGALHAVAWGLLICAISAYLAMNFTGASTYTSLSGVRREMRWALPLEGAMGMSGLVLWIVSLVMR